MHAFPIICAHKTVHQSINNNVLFFHRRYYLEISIELMISKSKIISLRCVDLMSYGTWFSVDRNYTAFP